MTDKGFFGGLFNRCVIAEVKEVEPEFMSLRDKVVAKAESATKKKKKKKTTVKPTLASELIVGDVVYVGFLKKYCRISHIARTDLYNSELDDLVIYSNVVIDDLGIILNKSLTSRMLKVIGYK